MWDQKTGNIIPRLPPRKNYLPKSNISNVILHQNCMAENTLELTLSNLRTQRQWARRSLEGSRQAFILRQLVQEETMKQSGLGHVSLLPQEVAMSHQSLLTHRTSRHHHHNQHGAKRTDLSMAYRMRDAPPKNAKATPPEVTAEMREQAARRRRGVQQRRHLESLHHKQAHFFEGISDGFVSLSDMSMRSELNKTPRLTVTPEPGFPPPTPRQPPPPPANTYNIYQNQRRLRTGKLMTLPSIVTPKVFSENDPQQDKGIFRKTTWRQEGSWH